MAKSVVSPQKLFLCSSLALGVLVVYLLRSDWLRSLPRWIGSLLGISPSIPGKQATGKAVEMGAEEDAGGRGKRSLRVFIDGCFDLTHLGHANALRQAKALGDVLVVGVCSEQEMVQNKGPPVLTTEERLALVSSMKWVDEVIPDTPYCISPEFLQSLFTNHRIDLVVHGDDPCLLPDGSDAYASAKALGKFREIKRTEGVSSTNILARILNCARHVVASDGDPSSTQSPPQPAKDLHGLTENKQELPPPVSSDVGTDMASWQSPSSASRTEAEQQQFLMSARRVVQFAGTPQTVQPSTRVVYIDGGFDLFHAGHAAVLEDARKLGDYLLVGVHSDAVVSRNRGPHHPVMCLNERAMSVLACRHVNDVIIGAPWVVTKDLIKSFNVSLVVHGSVQEANPLAQDEEEGRFLVAKQFGIFHCITSRKDVTTSSILQRVLKSSEAYHDRHTKRSTKESTYYGLKGYVAEH